MAANILGKLLKKLRIEHGERLEEMAAKLGITPSCLSAIGSGRRQLSPKLFNSLKRSYRLSASRAEQIAMAADFCRGQIKIPFKDLTDTQRQLCAILAAKIGSADRQAIAKCYRALGISPKELQQWVRLFKMNQEEYRPFQQIIASMHRSESRGAARRKLSAELASQDLPAFEAAFRELQKNIELLKRRSLPKEVMKTLQNNIAALNQRLRDIESKAASLSSKNGAALSSAAADRDEEDGGGPGQETLDL